MKYQGYDCKTYNVPAVNSDVPVVTYASLLLYHVVLTDECIEWSLALHGVI